MHIMNYLDFLHEDLLNKIFDILVDLYEKDIEKTNNKLLKVKKLVEGLYNWCWFRWWRSLLY